MILVSLTFLGFGKESKLSLHSPLERLAAFRHLAVYHSITMLALLQFHSPLNFAPLIVLRNAIASHWLSSCSNLLENRLKIPRNQFLEVTLFHREPVKPNILPSHTECHFGGTFAGFTSTDGEKSDVSASYTPHTASAGF